VFRDTLKTINMDHIKASKSPETPKASEYDSQTTASVKQTAIYSEL
jgi:hypothetical protein